MSKANMVLTRKKRQSSRRLLSQLDHFDQDMIIGNGTSEGQENVVVNKGTNDRDFTVSTSSNNTAVNESTVNVKTLERCFNGRIDREMSNIVDKVEDRIQNATLTSIDNIVAPKTELAIRSINASSGRDVTSETVNSERGEHVGINASFENASGNNNTLGVSNRNDETRHNIPDEVSELSVPETHFDRQSHTHYMVTGPSNPTHHNTKGSSVNTSTGKDHLRSNNWCKRKAKFVEPLKNLFQTTQVKQHSPYSIESCWQKSACDVTFNLSPEDSVETVEDDLLRKEQLLSEDSIWDPPVLEIAKTLTTKTKCNWKSTSSL